MAPNPADPTATLTEWLRGNFLRYQLRWILESTPFSLILKGRQMGLTDASAAGCILGAFRDRRPQIVLSAAQDNANALLDAVRAHCTFLAKIGLPAAADFAIDNAEEIAWRSGGSVIALAANPRTARSYHGDVWFDEFAYHQDPEAMWAAASPMATRGDWRIRVISTPNGATGLFYEWCSALPAGWRQHIVSLADAERDGLKVDRARLLTLVGGDPRVFAEAYECSFLDADLQYFPSVLADRARDWTGALPSMAGAEFFAGLDVGRHHDLTVLTVIAVLREVAWVIGVFTAKRTAFKAQRRMVARARQVFGWSKLLIDKGGLGEQLAEEMVDDWGEEEVVPVAFTDQSKADLATGMFRWLRDGRIKFSRDAHGQQLHADTCAVRRKVTPSGNVIFVSPRTKAGHGDHFWSAALAVKGASAPELPRGMGDQPLLWMP
jgi:phage FluMu gp28-like protein